MKKKTVRRAYHVHVVWGVSYYINTNIHCICGDLSLSRSNATFVILQYGLHNSALVSTVVKCA